MEILFTMFECYCASRGLVNHQLSACFKDKLKCVMPLWWAVIRGWNDKTKSFIDCLHFLGHEGELTKEVIPHQARPLHEMNGI